jgi:uncharacterized integral membrane protein
VICVVAFAFYNVGSSQTVELNLVFVKLINVPLITVVFWSFVAGVLVSLFLFASTYIRLSLDLRATRRRNAGLENELSILRNRPIEESVNLLKGTDRREPDAESPFAES